MKLLQRDLTQFEILKAVPKKDTDGCVYNDYEPLDIIISGNIQPYSENRNAEAYGINVMYSYAVYTTDSLNELKENDRLENNESLYTVKVIQKWQSYSRILVELVI